MNVYDTTVTKIRQLPESLVQEVNDFIDFLLVRQDSTRWQLWIRRQSTYHHCAVHDRNSSCAFAFPCIHPRRHRWLDPGLGCAL